MSNELEKLVINICRQARAASLSLATLSTASKNTFLVTLAKRLLESEATIIAENAKDLQAAKENGLSQAMLERLTLNAERIQAMAEGVLAVAALADPVGEEIEQLKPPRGLDLRKVRVPIGVIGIIYESRPNVTIDCAILCLKSGNACILRGGRESFHSNRCLGGIIEESLLESGIDQHAVQLIPTTDRAALNVLLQQDETVRCIIPRGGEGLIRFVVEHSRIPVIKHYTGVCSVYVDVAADPEKAEAIVLNAKCQRPSVCNAAENLLIHVEAAALLPRLAKALHERGVELRVDTRAAAILGGSGVPFVAATEADWSTEYNDLILAIAVVADTTSAIAFINRYGSGHSDAIVTEDPAAAQAFLAGVDASTVYHNASTRFTDGFEFGLGAEIGISTDRLHARGPMGLRELCTYKFVVHGKGEIRE